MTRDAPPPPNFVQQLLALLAVSLPLLLARSAVPDSVFYNQVAACAGWGLWLLFGRGAGAGRIAGLGPALAALALCLAFAAAGLDRGQAAPALLLAAAGVVLAASAGRGSDSVEAMAWAWLVGGLACVVVALLQYFAPSLADGWLVAVNGSPGRAIGNLRQPNHLATALLCAIVMTAWLWHAGRLRSIAAGAAIVAMVLAVALSASRTGALSLGVLLLWALLDRSLPRAARWTLALTPLAYLLFWGALAEYALWQQAHFYAAERLQSSGDISSSRFAIWRNALSLVAQNPWTGVGWGNFNFAWTFTPFPDRPVAFFDHTHNLPLQLAVEIGVPATAAVLGLLAWALWRARGALRVDAQAPGHPGRAVFVMLVMLAVHSLLEYPLWYAYFLLPAAWALGVLVGSAATASAATDPRARATAQAPARSAGAAWASGLAGVLMLAGAVYATWDHLRIEAIYAPAPGAPPLGLRIAEGRSSLLFGHHADYAAVTNPPRDPAISSFRRPLHQLVDVRLLIAYIEALRAEGRTDAALYAAQRLREFRRDDAQAYFAACTPQNPAPPFQCETKPVALNWRDLEP